MDIEQVGIEDLNEAKYNPRRMRPQKFAKLKDSIRDFGFVDPVIANKQGNVIIGGHMRTRAARELGYTEVPVVWLDLDETMEKALNVALNNAELAGEWDTEKLVDVLESIKAKESKLLSASGFEDHQLAKFKRTIERMREERPVYPLASKMMEHYDYVVIFCETETDFVHLKNILGVGRARSYKKQRQGTGRVVPFREFIDKWEGRGASTAKDDEVAPGEAG